jgi:hypothetical protein
MSDHTRVDEVLPAALEAAVESLRVESAPADLWRQRLLHELSRAQIDRRRARWSVRPWLAIAACLACVVVGAAAATLVGRLGETSATQTALHARVSTVRFTLRAPAASRVSLVGDFDDWNPRALPMRRVSGGAVWVIEVPLAAGRYAYSFVVDGALARDPQAPQAADDDFGSPNSVILVKGS